MGCMADVRPVRIGDDRYTGSDSTPVRSPFDGRELARVPVCTAADVDRAVAAARRALDNQPLPPWKRAEILDAAARGLAARTDELARTIAGEAAKPLKAARVEAARAVSTFTFGENPTPTRSAEALVAVPGNLNRISAVVGAKWNIWRTALVTANLLAPLVHDGLTAPLTPVIGAEWSF